MNIAFQVVLGLFFAKKMTRHSVATYHSSYRQAGAVRDAYKGRKAWIPPEVPKGLRSQAPWNPSDLTFGSKGGGLLQTMAGAKVRNVFGLFATNLQPKIDYPVHSKAFIATAL